MPSVASARSAARFEPNPTDAATIASSPAERTSSTLGAFRVDPQSGKLTYLGSTPTEKQPRGFAIDPTSRFVIVSGEKSDTISSYAIDAESGALKLIGRYPTGKGTNWVEIVSFD